MKQIFWALLGLLLSFRLSAEKVISAYFCRGDVPHVDGRLVDLCWQSSQVANDFIQNEPDEGKSSTERTEVRVVFSRKDLYVGIKAFDSSAGGPKRYLARRDSVLPCDWLTIWVDSLGDKRTAFQFCVNPSGVKRDVYWYDEERLDSNWDPVWDVAVHVDQGFWSVEFKIPFSQLRFPRKKIQNWGFQVERQINRIQEKSYWAPVPRGSSRFVSLFGTLIIGEELPAPRKLQLLPYGMAKLTLEQKDEKNPFSQETELSGNAGIDIKYGVSSNFTLDLTANPDFGQVESDPSFINLTAYEVFLQEKRPFFIEGGNIYRFTLSGEEGDEHSSDSLFYSRRIGRQPQGVPEEAEYTDMPLATPIAFAFKLTGKTENGWSVGVMEALTPRIGGDFMEGGRIYSAAVEPLTNFSIARVQKDFRQGRSAIGGILTFVHRDIRSESLDFLTRNALAGGIDFRHRWGNDAYELSGALVGSRVTGSTEAIRQLQESSTRYYQRPDNDYTDYDSFRTSLSGYAFRFSLGKIDGGHWQWSVGANGTSPGFEVNDLGYLREADTLSTHAWLQYRDLKPNRVYRNLHASTSIFQLYDFAPEYMGWGMSASLFMTFLNYWNLNAGIRRMNQFLSWATLRGGPAIYMPGTWNLSAGIGTDERRPLSLRLNAGAEHGDEGLKRLGLELSLTARLRENLSLEVSPWYNTDRNPLQYVDRITGSLPHYIFARINQKTFSLTFRLNYALTPDLTLQLYAQPFISSGLYTHFKEGAQFRAKAYANRWHEYGAGEISRTESGYDIAVSGDRFSIENPDFNFQQFRLNMVLRWEYRPGSAVYLVWTQGRVHELEKGRFHLSDDLHALFSAYPTNIFLVKFSYWFNF